jgi:hypothetical protein
MVQALFPLELCTVQLSMILPRPVPLLIIDDVQVLLLFTLLPSCARWQVVETTASVVLQIMESQVRQLCRLYGQILEGLRFLVDYLIQRLLLKLVGRCNLPVEELVEIVRKRLKQTLRYVDVATLLYDLTIDQLGDLTHAVIRWSVELECLASGCVIVSNLLKSLTDVDCLKRSAKAHTNTK